jgi:hypothetical protein
MIGEALAYAVVVALLVGLAAASVEQLLAELGLPRRFAWFGAYAAALVFPLLAMLLAEGAPAPIVVGTGAASGQAATLRPPIDWDTVLLQLWAAASTLLLFFYAAAWVRLAALAKRWPKADDDSSVLIADDVGPAVLGVLKPRIVLPRWLMESPASMRSTVMAHELEHIAARDQVLIVAAQLVTVLLPWNLPLWWFARRLRLGIEVDCDARVLRRGIGAEHYADVLLAVGQRRSFSPHVAATLIEPVTQLERRIRIMLTRRKPGAVLRATATAALALAIAACVTRVEPPVVWTDAEPSAGAREEPVVKVVNFRSFLSRMPKRDPTWNGLVVYSEDGTPTVLRADRMAKNEDGWVLEGNVKIDVDRTSITASRAVAKVADDGSVALQLDDAVVTMNTSVEGEL